MSRKQVIYIAISVIGTLLLALGLMYDLVRGAPVDYSGVRNTGTIVLGALTFISGLILFNMERAKVIFPKPVPIYRRVNLPVVLLLSGLIVTLVCIGMLYGQVQKLEVQKPELQLPKPLEEGPFHNMWCKKVIIRNDDVGSQVDLALKWLSALVITKDIKATYAVIPAQLREHPDTIVYLNNLDREHFEMATHGYKHIHFGDLPYEEQYSLIEQGTKIMEDCFHVRPCTFVPPYHSDDINTTRACKTLGYHTISSHPFSTSYILDFASMDFGWEAGWHPLSHHSYYDFKTSFDNFYNSSGEFFVVVLHHKTFLTETGKLNENVTRQFESSIDYMKSKGVKFMTIEQAYQWHIDEHAIRWGRANERTWFIDLATCQYDHTVEFGLPLEWKRYIAATDISTGDNVEKVEAYDRTIRFNGLKGHCYEITLS